MPGEPLACLWGATCKVTPTTLTVQHWPRSFISCALAPHEPLFYWNILFSQIKLERPTPLSRLCLLGWRLCTTHHTHHSKVPFSLNGVGSWVRCTVHGGHPREWGRDTDVGRSSDLWASDIQLKTTEAIVAQVT